MKLTKIDHRSELDINSLYYTYYINLEQIENVSIYTNKVGSFLIIKMNSGNFYQLDWVDIPEEIKKFLK
jgi:hypothetical protein